MCNNAHVLDKIVHGKAPFHKITDTTARDYIFIGVSLAVVDSVYSVIFIGGLAAVRTILVYQQFKLLFCEIECVAAVCGPPFVAAIDLLGLRYHLR